MSTRCQHSARHAFPGGRIDEGATPEQVALRELHEAVSCNLARALPSFWVAQVMMTSLFIGFSSGWFLLTF
ncbi:MAG: NUDIX domain-containing protein [Gammaproteobacteria bacterium]|nr:NUDIX domain-containing protein [Gammaproteobacteria bacterium]